MMSKKSPQLRFEGFTDDWEQRKLGELSQKISVGIATSSSKYFSSQDHGVPFIKNQDIKENRINTKNLEYISKEFDNKNKNKRVKQGDIITARTGYPGLSAVVPKELEGAQTFTTLITRPISEMILSEYISIFINSPYGMKQISGMEAGGAQKNVNAGIVQNLLIPLPSLDEQKKISNFILKLDDTIALHQRKLDLLKEQKKGYLQKMFPKNGAKVPELRFAGFADDWEERKLGDHAKYRRGSFPQPYGNKEWYDGEGAMPFVQVVDVTNKLTLVENTKQKISKLAQSKSVFVPKGKVVVTLQGSIGRVAITQYDSFVDRTLLIFEDYEKETDERFWAYTIQKKFEIEKIKAPGGTIKTITKEALSSFDVHLPKFEEQQKIGSFFKQLDDIIALHQRKLDLLKEQKKGFLQKMFV